MKFFLPPSAASLIAVKIDCSETEYRSIKQTSLFLLVFGFTLLLGSTGFGQVRVKSGTYTIPGTITLTDLSTVTVGATGTPIGDVIDALNLYAVETGGTLVFNVPANYVEYATKSYSLGGTSTNFFQTVYTSITFQKSGAGANPKIRAYTGTGANDFFIQLLGADNVTFNGIDLEESSTNTSAYNVGTYTKPMEYGYYIRNSSTGANNNTIKNCVVRMHRIATTYNSSSPGAADTNTSKSIGIYQFNDNAATPNNGNVYDSVWILKAYKGIFLDGLAGTPDVGTEIKKCIIGGNNTGGSPGDIGSAVAVTGTIPYTCGLESEYQKDLSIHDCEIMNVVYNRSTANATNGVSMLGSLGNCSFFRNKIHDVYSKYNSSGTSNTVAGVKIDLFEASSTLDIYNNMIFRVEHNTTSGSASNYQNFGLAIASCAGNINLYHNTISLTTPSIQSRSVALYLPAANSFGGTNAANTATFTLFNNLFKNSCTLAATNRIAYEFVIESGTLSRCNYNIYDSTAAQTTANGFKLGRYFGTDYNTLVAWRTISGVTPDLNSPLRFAVNLLGSGVTDAHLAITLPDSRYNGLSIGTAGYPAISNPVITEDIDKDPYVFYYMGADEPNFLTPTVRITNNNPSDSSVTRGTTQPLAGVILTPIGAINHITRLNFGTATGSTYLSTDFTNLKLYWSTTNSWSTAALVPSSNSFATIPAAGPTNLNFTFPSFTLDPAIGSYYFFVLFDIPGPTPGPQATSGASVRVTNLDSSRVYLDAGTTKIGDVPQVFQGGLQTVVDVYYNWGDSLPGIQSAYIDSLVGWYDPYTFSPPISFSADNQTFVFIHNNSLMTGLAGSSVWSVTGNNSKIIVGDPTKTAAVTFIATDTIVTSSTGVKIDIKSGGTLRLRTDSIPDFGTLYAGSTVDYFGAGVNQLVRNANYHNLTLSGTGTRTFAGSVGIAGAFTPNNYSVCPVMGVITFNGTTVQTVPGRFTYRGLRINNSSGIATITAPTSSGGRIIIDSTLTVSTNFTISAADSLVLNPVAKVRSLTDTLLVNGKFFNTNPTDTAFLGTTTSTLQFGSGSTYSLDGALVTTSGGQIPAATWAATSNLAITDVRNPTKAIRVGTPTPVGFGNVSFDAPLLAATNYKVLRNFVVGGTGSAGTPFQVNIQGDLLLGRTNSLNADLNSDSSSGSGSYGMTINIGGNLVQRAGTYTFNNSSSAAVNNLNVSGKDSINATYVYTPSTGYSLPSFTMMAAANGTSSTLNVTGDIVLMGAATLDISASTASKPGTIKAGSNFTAGAGSTVTETGTTTTNEIQFTKTGTQTLTTTGATFANDISYRVLGSSTTALGTSSDLTVNGGATIYVNSGGVFDITAGNTLTVNGLFSNTGTYSGTSTSNLILGGTVTGSMGTVYFTPGSAILNNLSLDRSGAAPFVTFGGTTGLTVHGNLSIGAANTNNTIDLGVNALAAAGSFATSISTANTASLKTQNTTSTPLPVNKNWGGTVLYNSASAQTMVSGTFANINGTGGNRTLSSTGTIGIAGNSASATCFTPGAGIYTVTGSTVDFNGNGAFGQNIPAFTFENLVISNGATTKTLVGNIAVQESVTLSNTTTLELANFNMNLLSTASKTARLNPVTTAATIGYSGSGLVFAQRYIPARRSWRLLTAPLDPAFSHTISEVWQEGQTLNTDSSGTGFFATLISGGSTANGFDPNPNNSNTSIKYYNSGNWLTPANTNVLSVNSKEGWMLFVRGDRKNYGAIAGNGKAPTITTLRPRGRLYVGTKTITSPAGGFTAVGNPYASAVDYNSVTRTGSGWPVNPTYYVWDPYLGGASGQGAFVALTWNGTDFTRSVGASTYDNRYIPSGAAIMVDFPPGGSLTFNETDKNAANTTTAFRPRRPGNQMRTVLNTVNTDNTTYVSDGTLSLFGNSFNNGVDENDALKNGNYAENFGLERNTKILSIERRKTIKEEDTIFYYTGRMQQKKYQLQFIMDDLGAPASTTAFLEDTYLKIKIPVNMQDTTSIDFEVTSQAGSSAANRFRLVFKRSVTYTNINAYVLNSDIAVDWKVAEEFNISKYEIERSVDGNVFSTVSTKLPVDNNSKAVNYSWLDAAPQRGYYYYRIKSISRNAVVAYSDVVKVAIVRSSPSFYVFPNPVTDSRIQLQLSNAQAGIYNTRLISTNGQLINNTVITHPGGTVTHTIRPSQALTSGSYQLEVTGPDNKVTVIKVVVSKN